MSVSSISLPPTIFTHSPQQTQQPHVQAVADNDGDADDHGGLPDNDSVKSSRVNIKA